MKSASLAIAVASAALLAAPDTEAGGHRGGLAVRPSGGGSAPRMHHFHSHPHTRIFVGSSFFFWPQPYYYPAPYAYYAPEEAPAEPLMVDPYWYYCEEAAAYYPYVKECAGGWQRVLPPEAPLG
jgi:hypothetical protein